MPLVLMQDGQSFKYVDVPPFDQPPDRPENIQRFEAGQIPPEYQKFMDPNLDTTMPAKTPPWQIANPQSGSGAGGWPPRELPGGPMSMPSGPSSMASQPWNPRELSGGPMSTPGANAPAGAPSPAQPRPPGQGTQPGIRSMGLGMMPQSWNPRELLGGPMSSMQTTMPSQGATSATWMEAAPPVQKSYDPTAGNKYPPYSQMYSQNRRPPDPRIPQSFQNNQPSYGPDQRSYGLDRLNPVMSALEQGTFPLPGQPAQSIPSIPMVVPPYQEPEQPAQRYIQIMNADGTITYYDPVIRQWLTR